jgi:hypothetical protein
MLKWFICPDNSYTELGSCFQCDHECLVLPTRVALASERKWDGNPSTTQLLNGTMLEFLKITRDYGVDPKTKAFLVLGSKHHEYMAEVANSLGLPSEIALTPDGKNIFDVLVPYPDGHKLVDYKTWGSYKVAKALGIEKKGKDNFVQGTPDLFDVEMQLNNYRIHLKGYGIKILGMAVQITVRDGGLVVSKTRGITKNMYYVPIRVLPDDYVTSYFREKSTALLDALDKYSTNKLYLPPPCNNRESWDSRRCVKEYCDVVEYCPRGIIGGAKE